QVSLSHLELKGDVLLLTVPASCLAHPDPGKLSSMNRGMDQNCENHKQQDVPHTRRSYHVCMLAWRGIEPCWHHMALLLCHRNSAALLAFGMAASLCAQTTEPAYTFDNAQQFL